VAAGAEDGRARRRTFVRPEALLLEAEKQRHQQRGADRLALGRRGVAALGVSGGPHLQAVPRPARCPPANKGPPSPLRPPPPAPSHLQQTAHGQRQEKGHPEYGHAQTGCIAHLHHARDHRELRGRDLVARDRLRVRGARRVGGRRWPLAGARWVWTLGPPAAAAAPPMSRHLPLQHQAAAQVNRGEPRGADLGAPLQRQRRRDGAARHVLQQHARQQHADDAREVHLPAAGAGRRRGNVKRPPRPRGRRATSPPAAATRYQATAKQGPRGRRTHAATSAAAIAATQMRATANAGLPGSAALPIASTAVP
jgi:hypothetical protein